jgi:5-amino-6-(5-phospho-D-ribitylamino)uracil phosphatase
MPVRLIAIDIDGTLLDSQRRLSEANVRAISHAASRGVEVALITGRRFDFALPVARKLDCPLTMIVNNGALIRAITGETHVRHLLSRATARQVLEVTEPWRDAAAVVFDRFRENQVILEKIVWDDPIRGGYYSRNRTFLAEVAPLETCLTEDPLQVMLTGTVASMQAAERALQSAPFRAEFALAVTAYESRDFSMVDVIHPACSKGAALAEWARLRGYARQDIMAIGDNHNDREMLSFAGVPVIMGNAAPELKQQGWHETRSNDEDGVAAAIEAFVLRTVIPCV